METITFYAFLVAIDESVTFGGDGLVGQLPSFTGFVFDGKTTGKLQHTYFFIDDIYTDSNGNITGDSVDLSPCDYLLDGETTPDWESIFHDEIQIVVYE